MGKFPKHFDKKLPRAVNELADAVEKDYKVFLPVIKEMVDSWKNDNPGQEVSCKNCKKPGCCYQSVFVSFYEAFPIARRLRLEGRATSQFIAELRRIGEESEGEGRVAWFDKNQPCVFLTKKYECSIYDVRPLTCRAHFVISPPENCLPEAVDPEIQQLGSEKMQDSIIRQQMEFVRAMGLPRLEFYGTLPRMVAIVLEAMAKPPEEFLNHLLSQPYPLIINRLTEWMDGKNPFAKQRLGCERVDLGSVESVPRSGADT